MDKNWEKHLTEKYPLDRLEDEFQKIEKLGYTVIAEEFHCLIWSGEQLIIDADFYDDYHLNAADAIDVFWNKL